MKKLLISTLALCALIATSCGPSKAELAEQARQDSIRVADSIHVADSIAQAEAAAQILHNPDSICERVKDIYAYAAKNGDKKTAALYATDEFNARARKSGGLYRPCFKEEDWSSDGTCVVSGFCVTKATVTEQTDTEVKVKITKKSTIRTRYSSYEKATYSSDFTTQTVVLQLVDGQWKVANIICKDGKDIFKHMYYSTLCG